MPTSLRSSIAEITDRFGLSNEASGGRPANVLSISPLGPENVPAQEQPSTHEASHTIPESSGETAATEGAASGQADSGTVSLHSILKNIDVGFSREVYELETFAAGQAQADASAGLPRQDAPVTGELPIESQLKDRALSVFGEWESRVRRRFQDGIERANKQAGDCLVQMSHAVGRLRQLSADLVRAELRLSGYEQGLTAEEKSFGYKRAISPWLFWPVIGLLTVIDWVANVPIFIELYNTDSDFASRWREFSARAAESQDMAGLKLVWGKILFSPEAAVLALGTVIVLIVLSHFFGSNLRKLISLSSKSEEDESTPKLRVMRREAKWPCIGTGIGLVLMLVFLFTARHMIKPMSDHKLEMKKQALQRQIESAQKAEDSGNLSGQSDALDAQSKAQHEQEVLQTRADYASGISEVNGPMLLLNIVLVIIATSASYFYDEVNITESRAVDPTLLALEAKVRKLQEQKLSQQSEIQGLDRSIQDSLSTARHLSTSRPLDIWPAKIARLCSAIHSYRTENARVRGVDVQNINAFRTDLVIEWPRIESGEWYELPKSYEHAERDHEMLRSEYHKLAMGLGDSHAG